MNLLNSIHNPSRIRELKLAELSELCVETRNFLIETILENGGHFAANLGVVELTVALFHVYNFNQDKIIWDVGHQSYPFKIFTGRKNEIHNIRNWNGISGFPKIDESKFDHFGTGHSSTSISAALGISVALKQLQIPHKTIAVVGDGALTGGMAFEALNNVFQHNSNLLIIINDNQIGIDPNTGFLDLHLREIEKTKPNFFQNLGLEYIGPIDGHNLPSLIYELEKIKNKSTPHILHIKTVKGKGYLPAEEEQTKWHSTTKFVKIETKVEGFQKKWQDVFSNSIIHLAKSNEKIVGITPAMPSGCGMIKAMEILPNRFFDVGIAEQHALTFAAGIATQKLIPIVNIYSTFLQRGYDQLVHDIALQNLHVIICIDRAGLVGEDGPTHHGSFDIAFTLPIPNLIITAPSNEFDFVEIINYACEIQSPFLIRYPKGNIFQHKLFQPTFHFGKIKCLKKSNQCDIAVVGCGMGTILALESMEFTPVDFSIYDLIFIKPLDSEYILGELREFKNILIIEDGCIEGGIGQKISLLLHENKYAGKVKLFGIPNKFVTHGNNQMLHNSIGMSPKMIAEYINSVAN